MIVDRNGWQMEDKIVVFSERKQVKLKEASCLSPYSVKQYAIMTDRRVEVSLYIL
jgi:hypothetical protein